MSLLDNLLNQLFPREKESKENQEKETLIREPIKHSTTFLNEYQFWLEEQMYTSLLNHIRKNYWQKKNHPESDVSLEILDKVNAKGFYCRAESPWTVKDYQFLVNYFLNQLKTAEYTVNNSSREVIEKSGDLLIQEIFYLRPKLKFKKELPYKQLFGNVNIEHRVKNDETDLVKVMVTTYTDNNYEQPYDFEDFINLVLAIEQ